MSSPCTKIEKKELIMSKKLTGVLAMLAVGAFAIAYDLRVRERNVLRYTLSRVFTELVERRS